LFFTSLLVPGLSRRDHSIMAVGRIVLMTPNCRAPDRLERMFHATVKWNWTLAGCRCSA
jgi:hypothetical protein